MEPKIKIEKITIREEIEVADEQARMNLKNLLADILKIKPSRIEMRFEDKTELKPFKNGL